MKKGTKKFLLLFLPVCFILYMYAPQCHAQGGKTTRPEKRYHYTIRTKQRIFLLYEIDYSDVLTWDTNGIYHDNCQYINGGTMPGYTLLLEGYNPPTETSESEAPPTTEPTSEATTEPVPEETEEATQEPGQEATSTPEITEMSEGTVGSSGGSMILPDVIPYIRLVTYNTVLGFGISFLLWFVGFLVRTGINMIKVMKEAA